MRPGAGVKPRSGSSALTRASMAWPTVGGGARPAAPPRATWSWSFTRSSPVVISVTGCSTWRRAFTSMNEKLRELGFVEELDGPGVAVAGGLYRAGRRHRTPAGSARRRATETGPPR